MVVARPLGLISTSISCSEWKPISGKKIGTSSFNSSQIVVAVGSDVHYLEIKDGELKETRCVRTCVCVCVCVQAHVCGGWGWEWGCICNFARV